MASPYRRVILKLSGEALGLDGKLFCHEKFEQVARMLIDIQHTGVELAVVIGGATSGAAAAAQPCAWALWQQTRWACWPRCKTASTCAIRWTIWGRAPW